MMVAANRFKLEGLVLEDIMAFHKTRRFNLGKTSGMLLEISARKQASGSGRLVLLLMS